ncbi:Ank2 [Symbiodinium pilosum]|uniref:Ank2 protein n=1 Tax=Symbiodinium pilosum TaxID=2952 RepID=A0A812RGJ5_SYMPI|nr:Ank2 [Symbiodinium pilosum]
MATRMADDAADATQESDSEAAPTCKIVLHGLQGERKELRDVPLRETFASFCRRVREVTGAFHHGHDVQLVHGAKVLTEASSTPLISMSLFNATDTDVELTYLFKEVLLDPENLHMGFTSVPARDSPPPAFDQALFNGQRRCVEWAREVQASREMRLERLVVAVPPGMSEAQLCIGSRQRLPGEIADAAWGRAMETSPGQTLVYMYEGQADS